MKNQKTSDVTSKTTTISDEVFDAESPVNGSPQRKHVKKYKQNWRLNLLSTPKYVQEKYQSPQEKLDQQTPQEKIEVGQVGVSPAAVEYKLPERIEHMSRAPLRTLVINKRLFTPIHREKYEKRMDERIELTWNSIYNVYKKARRDISRRSSASSKRSKGIRGRYKSARGKKDKKDKGAKGDKKGKDKGKKKDKKSGGGGGKPKEKTEEDIEKEIQEWINSRSKPKPVFKPEPIPRGPNVDLVELKDKMDILSTPKKVYTIETKDPTVIAEAALTYEATEKIIELAKPSPWRLVKEEPYVPGKVKPGALLYNPSPRIAVLAKPKETQNVNDTDLKEDPFAISPNALKYVATPRIMELAKPVER